MNRAERAFSNGPEEVLGFERTNINGLFQPMRGKKNIVYKTVEGVSMVAKYVNFKDGIRDNVAGMKREKQFLDLLEDTGLTPKVIDYKEYPNQKKVRLVLEKLPGKSLDKMSIFEKEDLMKNRAEEVILSSATSLEKVHQKGVLVVDVNEGTFLFDVQDETLKTYVLDFELSASTNPAVEKELEFAKNWFARKDFALKLDSSLDLMDPETLTKSEVYLWAEMLVTSMIGLSEVQKKIELSDETQRKFDEAATKIEAKLSEDVIATLKNQYFLLIKQNPELVADYGFESDYINENFELKKQAKLQTVLLGISLEEKLKKHGISLSPKILKFLQDSLSIDFSQRPKNFQNLLNT
jgi:serine/threonine protein kinase